MDAHTQAIQSGDQDLQAINTALNPCPYTQV